MDYPILYRKRIIPDEFFSLKDDIMLYMDEDFIITKWKAIHPKKDLSYGYSCYFLHKRFKVSKFFNHDHQLMYHYCDIVSYHFSEDYSKLTVTDLLVDVKICPSGKVEVLDLDELAQALREGKITSETLDIALTSCNELLELIYKGQADTLLAPFSHITIESRLAGSNLRR